MNPPEKQRKPDVAFSIMTQIKALASAERRGDLADLRRMDPDRPDSPAFFRILAKVAPEAGLETISRLALVANILAMKPELLIDARGADVKLGEALASKDGKINEPRVQRLLMAREKALDAQVRILARRLAYVGFMPWRDFSRLLLQDGEALEKTRLRIARDFWTKLDRDAAMNS